MSSISWSDTQTLETELNERFRNNPDYDIKNLVVYATVTDYSYIPIETHIDDEGYIRVADSPNLIGCKLFVGSKRQFLHKRIVIPSDTIKVELTNDTFVTGWDPSKYVVFRNGYLLNSNNLEFIIPNFDNKYLRKYFYSTVPLNKGDKIDIYYIECDDNFSKVSISRDMYVGAKKYLARRRNERVIVIPYPNSNFTRNEQSFFVFNDNGELLDNRYDYIVSANGEYITLSEEQALVKPNVDYIVFAFPQLPNETENLDDVDDEIPLNVGTAYFNYAYSLDNEVGDETGIIRFDSNFSDYRLTKKNFILFCNGVWINPDRYDIYTNNSIQFLSELDKVSCIGKKYTMVIYNDDSDHTSHQIPGNHRYYSIKYEGNNTIKIPKLEANYNTLVAFDNGVIIDNNRYIFDDYSNTVELYDNYPIGDEISFFFINGLINNTDMEREFLQYHFLCGSKPQMGIPLPYNLMYKKLEEKYLLLFYKGQLLKMGQDYDIIANKIYLNESYFIDDDDNIIDISTDPIDVIYLESIFTSGISKVSEKEARSYKQKWEEIKYDYVGGQVFRLYESKEWASKTESGIIGFYPAFDKYQLHKRNMLLFGHGTWIHPDRWEIYDNGTIIFNNEHDRKTAQWTNYILLIIDDYMEDDRYCPSSFKIEKVTATEDNQSVFEIPDVAKRYRSFMIFRGNLFLSKVGRYKINEEDHTIELLNDFDYLAKGRSLYFVFLDAFTRSQQETQIMQFNFDCDSSGITKLPKPLIDDEYQMNEIALFLNGRILDQSLYTISNNKIYLSGYLLADAQFDRYYYTVVYLITFLSEVREYDFTMPTTPSYPISPVDNVKEVYIENYIGTPYFDNEGQVVSFPTCFSEYKLVKSSIMLFKDGLFVDPKYYELYDNGSIWFNSRSPIQPDNSVFNMGVLVNNVDQSYIHNYPTETKTISVTVDSETNIITIPEVEEKYKSFLLFINGSIVDLTKVDFVYDTINLILDDVYPSDKIDFVFLNSIVNEKYGAVFLMDNIQVNGPTPIPTSQYNTTSFEKKYMMVFKNGKLLPTDEYVVQDNNITLISGIPSVLTIVHLVTVHEDDLAGFKIEERKEDTDPKGFIFTNRTGETIDGLTTFPNFDEFSINIFSFMLFDHDGNYVFPYSYKVLNNDMLRFFISTNDFHYMELLSQNTLKGNKIPISLKYEVNYIHEDSDSLFYTNSGDSFILFINGILIPNDEYTVDDFYIHLVSGTFKNKDTVVIVSIIDKYNEDRRKPYLIEYSFSDVSSSGEIYIPYYDMTKDDYSTPEYLVFSNGKYCIPNLDYTISNDNKIINVLNEDKFAYGSTITLVYFGSLVLDESEEKKPIEVITDNMKDPIPDDDHPTSLGLKFQLLESTRKSLDDVTGTGFVEFNPPFTGYTLTKYNFLLFSGSIWIDPERFEVLSNGLLYFPEDKSFAEMRKFYMLVFTNNEAIKQYGPLSYVKTKYALRSVYVEKEGQTEFELPVLDEDYQSYIVFRNGLIQPFFDNSRYQVDDTNHKFNIVNPADIPIVGDRFQFVFISTKTNSDSETYWNQLSFPCDGYKTIIPDDISVYLLDSLYKDKTMLFLNGTFIHPSRYSISDGHIYNEGGNYTVSPNSLYTLVYLTTNNAGDYEQFITDQVDDTYDISVDGFIFENRYTHPYVDSKKPVNPDIPTKVTEVDLLRCASDGITTHGVVKFNPTFNDYTLNDNNVLLFENGYLVEQSRYTIYTDNYIHFNSKEDRESAPNNRYDEFLPTDVDYYDYVAPIFKFSSLPVDKSNIRVFDIPVIDHMDNSSLLVFRKSKDTNLITLFYGYSVAFNQIKLNANTDSLAVGDELILVYFESTISKYGYKYQLIQSSFPVSASNNTIIPDRYLESDPDKILLFYEGVLLRRDEFSWDPILRKVTLLGYNRLVANTKYSIIQLEKNSLSSEEVRRT